MELTGTIIAVLPAQSGVSARTGNQWMKQDYVIEVPGQYPKKCVFNIFGEDRIRQLDIKSGEQNVTIQFDIDAHEFNGKWYNEVTCFNVLRQGQQQYQPQQMPQQPVQQQYQQAPFPPQQQATAPYQQQMPFPPAQ